MVMEMAIVQDRETVGETEITKNSRIEIGIKIKIGTGMEIKTLIPARVETETRDTDRYAVPSICKERFLVLQEKRSW